jgi:uncharacterized protein with GYD domain
VLRGTLSGVSLPSSPRGFLAVSKLRKRKGAHTMATYISLCHYTAEGIKEIREAPKRLDKAKALARKLGGEMKKLYLTMGSYDVVAIYNLPDDEAAAKFALIIGRTGAVTTTTLRAFSEGDYRRLVKELR